MGKRIEGGIICVVTAEWPYFALSIASHYQSYSPFYCLFIYHITGREVVSVSDMGRRPPSGSGGAMAALHLSSRRCRHSLPLRVLPRRRSPCHLLLRRGGCRSRRYVKTPLRHPTSSNSILTSHLLHCLLLPVLLTLLLSVYFTSNAGRRCWILRWGRDTQRGFHPSAGVMGGAYAQVQL